MKPEDVESVEKFEIKKVNNGYTIHVEYKQLGVGNIAWTKLGTLVAKDLSEVHGFVDDWLGV